MPTTFNVFSLGVQTPIDPAEGNTNAENASALVGETFGSAGAPLFNKLQTLAQGSTGFSGGNTTAYDQDNTASSDTFTIDGEQEQTFDAIAACNTATTYPDGTAASIMGHMFQDTFGNSYLAPLSRAKQDAPEAKAIEWITVDSLVASDDAGMTADREAGNHVSPDGAINGSIGVDPVDASDSDTAEARP